MEAASFYFLVVLTRRLITQSLKYLKVFKVLKVMGQEWGNWEQFP